MSDKKILDNFEIFDDMQVMYNDNSYMFANCIYTSLFTIAKYFKKEILPILANPVFVYEYNNITGKFVLKVIDVKNWDMTLDDIGISVNRKSPDVDALKKEIIGSISNGRPLSIYADMFYLPGMAGWYKKRHGAGHTFLVYGYDLYDDVIHIVDDIRGLNKYTLSFKDLHDSYNGHIHSERYVKGVSEAVVEYALKPDWSEPVIRQKTLTDMYITNYTNNMLLFKDEIISSLDNINQFSHAYEGLVKNDVLIDQLNSTIYRRLSENYRLLYLQRYGFDVLNICTKIDSVGNEIIDNWKRVWSITTKGVYSGKFDSDVHNKSKNLINRIYEKEKEYYGLLFPLIDKWKEGIDK